MRGGRGGFGRRANNDVPAVQPVESIDQVLYPPRNWNYHLHELRSPSAAAPKTMTIPSLSAARAQHPHPFPGRSLTESNIPPSIFCPNEGEGAPTGSPVIPGDSPTAQTVASHPFSSGSHPSFAKNPAPKVFAQAFLHSDSTDRRVRHRQPHKPLASSVLTPAVESAVLSVLPKELRLTSDPATHRIHAVKRKRLEKPLKRPVGVGYTVTNGKVYLKGSSEPVKQAAVGGVTLGDDDDDDDDAQSDGDTNEMSSVGGNDDDDDMGSLGEGSGDELTM